MHACIRQALSDYIPVLTVIDTICQVNKPAVSVALPFYLVSALGGPYLPARRFRQNNRRNKFVKANIANHPVEIFPLIPDRRRFKLLRMIERSGKRIWPNVFVYNVLFVVDVTNAAS